MQYEHELSRKMISMHEIIKTAFINCQKEYNDTNSSITQINNSINNLKLTLTQTQVIFMSLQIEYQNLLNIKYFFPRYLQELYDLFADFLSKELQIPTQKKLADQIIAYKLILKAKDNIINSKYLEIQKSSDPSAQELSHNKCEELFGEVLQKTQYGYESLRKKQWQETKFVNKHPPLKKRKNESAEFFNEAPRKIIKTSIKSQVEGCFQKFFENIKNCF